MGSDVGFDYVSAQDQPCVLCGHDTLAMPAADLAAVATDVASRWHEFLNTVCDHPGGVDELCRSREEGVWCAVEYACHVRDVLALFARRVEFTLAVERPEYAPLDVQAAALGGHYAQQDPRAVADDLTRAAAELSALAQPLTPESRVRAGTHRGAGFSVEGLIRVAIHEALHHLADARAAVAVAA